MKALVDPHQINRAPDRSLQGCAGHMCSIPRNGAVGMGCSQQRLGWKGVVEGVAHVVTISGGFAVFLSSMIVHQSVSSCLAGEGQGMAFQVFVQ